MRQSYTAVIERNFLWEGSFETEPYEAAWASQAIFFVRVLEAEGPPQSSAVQVQISPEGMHWCDEGTILQLDPGTELSWARVAHFGGWLRLKGQLPAGQRLKIIAYLNLKE